MEPHDFCTSSLHEYSLKPFFYKLPRIHLGGENIGETRAHTHTHAHTRARTHTHARARTHTRASTHIFYLTKKSFHELLCISRHISGVRRFQAAEELVTGLHAVVRHFSGPNFGLIRTNYKENIQCVHVQVAGVWIDWQNCPGVLPLDLG